MTTTLLVDGSNVAWAAFYVGETLIDHLGRPTGAIFGFLRMVRAAADQISELTGDTVKVMIAWDSSRESLWRRDVYPDYKASRDTEKTPEDLARLADFGDQVKRIRQILPCLGIAQIRAERFEADDLAGWLTRRWPQTRFVLMSGDYDWLQLVSPTVSCWIVSKAQLVTPLNFADIAQARYGVPLTNPDQYVRMKAIAGDDGDDVPGAPGIGTKTAGKYILGELAKKKDGTPTAKEQAIVQWLNDPMGYERSLRLVDLRDMQIPAEAVTLERGAFDESAFVDVCMTHSFDSIYNDLPTWIVPFKLAAVS